MRGNLKENRTGLYGRRLDSRSRHYRPGARADSNIPIGYYRSGDSYQTGDSVNTDNPVGQQLDAELDYDERLVYLLQECIAYCEHDFYRKY